MNEYGIGKNGFEVLESRGFRTFESETFHMQKRHRKRKNERNKPEQHKPYKGNGSKQSPRDFFFVYAFFPFYAAADSRCRPAAGCDGRTTSGTHCFFSFIKLRE